MFSGRGVLARVIVRTVVVNAGCGGLRLEYRQETAEEQAASTAPSAAPPSRGDSREGGMGPRYDLRGGDASGVTRLEDGEQAALFW